jgi:hypothetical protein
VAPGKTKKKKEKGLLMVDNGTTSTLNHGTTSTSNA